MFISNNDDEEIKNFYIIVSKNVKKYRNEKNINPLELALTIRQNEMLFIIMLKTIQIIRILIWSLFVKLIKHQMCLFLSFLGVVLNFVIIYSFNSLYLSLVVLIFNFLFW